MYGFIPSFPTKVTHPVKPIRHVCLKQLFAGLLKGGKMGLFLDRTPGEFSAVRFLLFGMSVMLSLPGKKPGDWIDIMGQKLYDSVTLNHTHKSCHLQVFYPDVLEKQKDGSLSCFASFCPSKGNISSLLIISICFSKHLRTFGCQWVPGPWHLQVTREDHHREACRDDGRWHWHHTHDAGNGRNEMNDAGDGWPCV